MLRPWIAVALSCGLGACAMSTQTRFDRYGAINGAHPRAPIVAVPADVQVFYGTGPAGFALHDGELRVEPGFHHEILGVLRVLKDDGNCALGGLSKQDVIDQLQAAARDRGGDAVVYAASTLSDSTSASDRCRAIDGKDDLGSGWIVVLGAAQADATASAH